LASLFEQWIATLASVASDALAHVRPRVALEAVEQPDGFDLRRADGGEIGRVGADGSVSGAGVERLAGAAVDVRLGARHRIVDSVTYPAATRPYLGAVIGNQIDRLAPFEDGDAVFAWKTGETAADGETIGVTVSVASRRRVVEAVRPLVIAGLTPARIVVGDDGVAAPVVVQLGRSDDVAGMRRAVNRTVMALVILAVVGYLGNWWLQSGLDRKLADVEAMLAARRNAVAQVAATGGTAAAGQKRVADIATDRARLDALPILNRLSLLLPDSVYLTNFDVEGAAVRISGLAADATPLVPLLENDPQIENAHFVAPLSRQSAADRVGFDLAFTWLPHQ
jgi:general secretion pathway protein L